MLKQKLSITTYVFLISASVIWPGAAALAGGADTYCPDHFPGSGQVTYPLQNGQQKVVCQVAGSKNSVGTAVIGPDGSEVFTPGKDFKGWNENYSSQAAGSGKNRIADPEEKYADPKGPAQNSKNATCDAGHTYNSGSGMCEGKDADGNQTSYTPDADSKQNLNPNVQNDKGDFYTVYKDPSGKELTPQQAVEAFNKGQAVRSCDVNGGKEDCYKSHSDDFKQDPRVAGTCEGLEGSDLNTCLQTVGGGPTREGMAGDGSSAAAGAAGGAAAAGGSALMAAGSALKPGGFPNIDPQIATVATRTQMVCDPLGSALGGLSSIMGIGGVGGAIASGAVTGGAMAVVNKWKGGSASGANAPNYSDLNMRAGFARTNKNQTDLNAVKTEWEGRNSSAREMCDKAEKAAKFTENLNKVYAGACSAALTYAGVQYLSIQSQITAETASASATGAGAPAANAMASVSQSNLAMVGKKAGFYALSVATAVKAMQQAKAAQAQSKAVCASLAPAIDTTLADSAAPDPNDCTKEPAKSSMACLCKDALFKDNAFCKSVNNGAPPPGFTATNSPTGTPGGNGGFGDGDPADPNANIIDAKPNDPFTYAGAANPGAGGGLGGGGSGGPMSPNAAAGDPNAGNQSILGGVGTGNGSYGYGGGGGFLSRVGSMLGFGPKKDMNLAKYLPKKNRGPAGLAVKDGVTGSHGPSLWQKLSISYQKKQPEMMK